MKLTLQRQEFTPLSTIGRLSIDGVEFCWTLEDTVRSGPKVPGRTAIPAGTYAINVTFSPRFKRMMPMLIAVPGFLGVRIHPGNTPEETEGCILVGFSRGPDALRQSRMAFDELFPRIDAAEKRGEPVSIEIS